MVFVLQRGQGEAHNKSIRMACLVCCCCWLEMALRAMVVILFVVWCVIHHRQKEFQKESQFQLESNVSN